LLLEKLQQIFHVLTPRGSANQSCSSSTLMPRERISLTSTLKDSGMPAFISWLPSTIALYISVRPCVSSDLTVSISCRVYAAPYASSAQTSISPKRWPPNCALPPSGCCVTSEYGPVERACNLSSTMCDNFSIYMYPTATSLSNGSPVRPS